MEHALELMPEIVGDETVGVKYAINGLLSLTPDGMPILGETPEVKGLWSVAAVWVKEGPGIGKSVAEWMVHGESEIDLHSSDIARFHEHQKTRAHVRARAAEGFNKTYGIVHPGEQWASNRDVRLSPFHARERELGAVFFEAAGWERPQWYESNAPLLEEYGDRINRREAEWDARWWSPIINAEHLAMRDRAGMVDLTAFAIFDIAGPGALAAVQGVAVRQMDVPVGRVVYTPILSPGGGFKADLTIMRLGDDLFRVVTGGAHGMADRKWFADHLPADGTRPARRPDVGAGRRSGCGARAPATSWPSLTRDDVSHEGFRFGTCRTIEIDTLRVLASRISYVGDLGWELYVPIEQGAKLWDLLWEAGQPHGLAPVGIGVYGTTGRLEKCYRAYGFELESEYNVVEAGMAGPKVKDEDFVGSEAHLRHREEEPAAILCTLTVDDHTSSTGVKRYMLGREPILTRDGAPLIDRKGAALVRDERRRRAVDRQAHPDGLPAARARARRRAARGRVPGRALPGHGRRGRPNAAVRPREREDPLLVNILCCVKRVPMTGGRIVLTADEQAIETRHLGFTISPHEECGVEEAVRLIEAHGGSSTVLTLGPAEAEEQLRDAMALGIDRAILLLSRRGVGRPGDRRGDRRGDRGRASGRHRVRPDLLRQRVGRRGQLPGRDPGRARARPALRDRPQGHRRRRRRPALRAGGGRRARRLPGAAARRGDGQGGPEPAPLPVRARAACGRSESRSRRARRPAPAPGSRRCGWWCRRARASRRRSSAQGPAAAPAVVEVLQQAGLV